MKAFLAHNRIRLFIITVGGLVAAALVFIGYASGNPLHFFLGVLTVLIGLGITAGFVSLGALLVGFAVQRNRQNVTE